MEVSGRRSGPFHVSSAVEGEVFCQPCSSDDDWVVAKGYCQNCNEYFCTACLKLHRKQSVSKNHVILEGERMPRSPALIVCAESCSDLCLKHSNEIIKFYCPTHDTIGCSDCMVLDHKVCKVERIQDISRDYFRGHEHRQLIGKVQGLLENINEIRASLEIAGEDVNACYTKAVADIMAFRKDVNDYLDSVQAEILTEVNKRKQRDDMNISHTTDEHQNLRKEIKTFEEKLQQQSNKSSALFVAAKQMKARMSSFKSIINRMLQTSKVEQYKFEPSSNMKHVLSSQDSLGKLTEHIKDKPFQRKLSDMEAQFDEEINLKTTEDTNNCWIMSSALISLSHIVLADCNNLCIKMVDLKQKKVSSMYNLTCGPWDVTVISINLIAVALRQEQKIKFLSITKQYNLTESHDIEVNGEIQKLACQNDNLIIGYENSIEILTMTGKVVRKITVANSSMIMSISTAPDSKTFYVCHNYDNQAAVHKFDLDGNQLATYKDSTLPVVKGLTVTPDGTVLACNYTKNGSIHLISPECKKIKEILLGNEHVICPYCVSFCSDTSTLFLFCYKSNIDPKLKNVLKSFKMI